jgi:ABC-type phosphate/phosphonate transport system substrate-binding protein
VYIEAAAAPGVTPIAMKLFDGSTGTDGVMLVRDESSASGAADLKGKTVCMADQKSSTGYLLPRQWLRVSGLDPDKDVTTRITGNHFKSIRDLEAAACDAAAVYSGAWLAADEAGASPAQFRVLAITGRTPHDAIVASPGADPAIVASVTTALVGLDPKRDLGVDRIGDAERITGFSAIDDARWDDLRKALAAEKPTKPK